MIFKELKTKLEFAKAYSLYSLLVPFESYESYEVILKEMLKKGYRVFVIEDEAKNYLSLAGIFINSDFFNGKHLWINELVTIQEKRSNGLGKLLVTYLENLAKEENCHKIVLYSGLGRRRAHKFWEKYMNFERRGIIFKKEL